MRAGDPLPVLPAGVDTVCKRRVPCRIMPVSIKADTYERLYLHFKRYPGDCMRASREMGIDYRTARRVWDGGGPKGLYLGPYRAPLPDWMHGHATVKARLAAEEAAEKAARENEDTRVANRARELGEKERALREEAVKVQDDILRIARRNVLNGLVSLARLTEGIDALTTKINRIFVKNGGDENSELPVTLPEAFLILNRWQSTARGLIQAADTLVQIERLRADLPTAIVGVEIQNVTIADAEREHALASTAIERAKKLGLLSLAGGKG